MTEEKKKEKKDYLKIAKNVYESTKTYDSPVDRCEIQAAQTVATIAIAEELRRLNESIDSFGRNGFDVNMIKDV